MMDAGAVKRRLMMFRAESPTGDDGQGGCGWCLNGLSGHRESKGGDRQKGNRRNRLLNGREEGGGRGGGEGRGKEEEEREECKTKISRVRFKKERG
jgi:hypothetical protein